MKRLKIGNRFPLGYDNTIEMVVAVIGLIVCFLCSFQSFNRYFIEYRKLFKNGELINGAMIEDFNQIVGGLMKPYSVMIVLMIGFIIWHYFYHFSEESNVIYILKRTKNSHDFWIRVFINPMIVIGICVVARLLTLFILKEVYLIKTPLECVDLSQSYRIW